MNKIKYLLIAFAMLFLASCGDDVVYQYNLGSASFEVTVLLEDWALADGFDNIWVSSANAGEIDDYVLNGGFVLFYIYGNGVYSPLPYTFPELDGDITFQTQLTASYEYGYVNFEFLDLHPTNPLPPPRNYRVKVVVVQGDEGYIARDVDLGDYNQVVNAFNPKVIELEVNEK